MSNLKKLVALIISAITILLPCTTAFAEEKINTTVTFYGITYQVNETYDLIGNKVITVVGGNETNTIVSDGKNLTITKSKKDGTKKIIHNTLDFYAQPNTVSLDSYGSLYTPFWNYSYYWNNMYLNEIGLYWALSSGNSNGSKSAFDGNNLTARGYAESFMSDVGSIYSQQIGAIAAIGTAAAGAIAGAITAETGVGAIVGIVLAVGGSLVSVSFWVVAYTSSLSANYNFSQFKALVN